MSTSKKQIPSWDKVEKQILDEINWLRSAIEIFSETDENSPIKCKECLLRRIATLIVTGKVKATNILKTSELRSFWVNHQSSSNQTIFHGKEWHSRTMEQIEFHFKNQGFSVVREPNLTWGRADLGIHKKGEQNLFIEVGTTSFFKLWINLERMTNFTYLLVPNDDLLIEFIKD